MGEHFLRVTRTARYHTLGEPGARVREVWIVCHGYGQLAGRLLRHFAPIAHPSRLIAAPEALSRFYLDPALPHSPDAKIGATWMTREDREHEIADYVAYLDALAATLLGGAHRSRVRLVALGFSQGVSTVMRWLAQGQSRADRLIAWSGSIPQDIDFGAARDRFGSEPVAYAYGDRDPYFGASRNAQQMDLLRGAGIPLVAVPFAGGHAIDADTLVQVAGPPPD